MAPQRHQSVVCPFSGRVRSGLPRSLDKHDPVSIGSDRGCEITIEGAAPRHAELHWEAETEKWTVHGSAPSAEILVNGLPLQRAISLDENDRLCIAGVCIRYADGKLAAEDEDRPVGLCVCVRNVSAYAGGKRRIDNVSFRAGNGSFVALLGPSGCGKSTLIQRIAGLAPFEGEVLFNGRSISCGKDDLLPLVEYLPQSVEDTLHADMTVREAMEDFADRNLPRSRRPDFAAKLHAVDLDYAKIESTLVRAMSGGMKRRFALALALMRNPQLLLLDEPTSGLDPAAEANIMDLLRRIADQGRTVLCATHVLSSLDKCDKVAILAPGGRLSFFGAPSDAIAHFGGKDWLTIYRSIAAGDCMQQDLKSSDAPCTMPCTDKEMPEASPAAAFGQCFSATLKRLWRTARSKHNACLFFGTPVAVALVLAWSCGSMFGEKGRWETACFCMSVAMFWLGLAGSVRSLVSERTPKRCLDRMRGIPLACYFPAHVAFVAISAIVQSLLFTVPVFILRQHQTYFSWHAFPAFSAVLAITCFAGGCAGLAASAYAKKEIQAVWMLPFIAIVALFLSKPVLKPTGDLDTAPCHTNTAFVIASWTMPTISAQEYLGEELKHYRVVNYYRNKKMPDGSAVKKMPDAYYRKMIKFLIVPGLAYPLFFLSLAFLLQRRKERMWDGR